jgi:hypothetical protein
VHGIYSFAPTVNNTTQVGNRFVVLNAPTATNTAVGTLVRMNDNTVLSNNVIGLEVIANGGSNTWGRNTAIRGTGATFGVAGFTSGLAGGSSTPAALYGESTGTTLGDVLRLYSSSLTTASSVAQFFQETSAFSGTGLLMNFGKGGGSFTGNFLDLQVNDNSRFRVTYGGTTTIGQVNQTVTQAGLQIGFGGLCVDNDGSCVASTSGRISAVSYTTGNADLAEAYLSTEELQPGEIVYAKGGIEVGRASTSGQPILGVVSTHPGLSLGTDDEKSSPIPRYPIGLSGRVPVLISDEHGPIQIGDRIVLSSVPGIGMKSTSTRSTMVGIALESFDGTRYYSTSTIDVETVELATTTTTCAPAQTRDGTRLGGGLGSEQDGDSVPQKVLPSTEAECSSQVKIISIPPDQKPAIATTTTEGKTVNVGKILMFIKLEVDPLEHVAGDTNIFPGLSIDTWGENAEGTRVLLKKGLSLEGNGIFNVAEIRGVGDAWYIDSEGNIKARRIDAEIVHTDQICIGNTCIDGDKLNALLQATGVTPLSEPPQGSTTPTDTTSTSTETTTSGSGTSSPEELIPPSDTGATTSDPQSVSDIPTTQPSGTPTAQEPPITDNQGTPAPETSTP